MAHVGYACLKTLMNDYGISKASVYRYLNRRVVDDQLMEK